MVKAKSIEARLEQLEQEQPTPGKPLLVVYHLDGRYFTAAQLLDEGTRQYYTPAEMEELKRDYDVLFISYVDTWRDTDVTQG